MILMKWLMIEKIRNRAQSPILLHFTVIDPRKTRAFAHVVMDRNALLGNRQIFPVGIQCPITRSERIDLERFGQFRSA